MCVQLAFSAINLFALGLIGEYVGRSYIQGKGRPPFIIRSVSRATGDVESRWTARLATQSRTRRNCPVAKAEFDSYADTYYEEHKKNIKITGEDPEYFAEYKVADLAHHFSGTQSSIRQIADFGSGIGNSIPYFRRYFPDANLSCVDVSARSIRQAQDRFPGNESFLLIEGESIPIDNASRDIVFSLRFSSYSFGRSREMVKGVVAHHRPGGVLAIYEQNPLNPLTVRAFNTCPLDKNAVLIRAGTLRSACLAAGWSNVSTAYRLFFPRSLKYLRPLERRLGWLCIGAQYRLLASRR